MHSAGGCGSAPARASSLVACAQVLEGSASGEWLEQQQIVVEQAQQLERELAWVAAKVARQRDHAAASFLDQDYAQYCEQQLLPAVQELQAANQACLVQHIPHLRKGAVPVC